MTAALLLALALGDPAIAGASACSRVTSSSPGDWHLAIGLQSDRYIIGLATDVRDSTFRCGENERVAWFYIPLGHHLYIHISVIKDSVPSRPVG